MAKTDFNFDSVSLTEDVLNAAKAKTILNEGWHAGLVVDAESQVSEKKGSLMSVMTLAPLKDPTDADSRTGPTGKYWMVHPFKNPEVSDHNPPDTAGMAIQTLQAIFGTEEDDGGIPRYPRKNKETGEFEYQGSIIDAEDVATVKSQLTEKGLQKALQVLKDPALLVSDERAVYFKVEHDEYEGIKQHRITRLAVNLPEGASLVAPDDIKVKVASA